METEEGFLSELTGMFNANGKQNAQLMTADKKNQNGFRQYLRKKMSKLPDAIPSPKAAELLGTSPQGIYRMFKEGKIYGIILAGKLYCSKEQLIDYLCSMEKLRLQSGEGYRELIRGYLKSK